MDLFSLDAYDYDLPAELIAQKPAFPRDSSRLLVLDRKKHTIEHRSFKEVSQYVKAGDIFVANNTKVIKARLLGYRMRKDNGKDVQGGKIEFLMLREIKPLVWEGIFHASAKHVPGLIFEIPVTGKEPLRGELLKGETDTGDGTVVAKFNNDPIEYGAGVVPLPPYIRRDILEGESNWADPSDKDDEKCYQTVYAKNSGSAAAPTAGLHFTQEVMDAIKKKGADWLELTLHVGLGTFRPVKENDIRKHVMHEEYFDVSDDVVKKIHDLKTNKNGEIIAVGTTSVRTLESIWKSNGLVSGCTGKTSIFIYPGSHEFKVVDHLLTNFHLPKSTLLMLVCAFAGRDFVLEAYRAAVKEKYRFFSYGDAMLIL